MILQPSNGKRHVSYMEQVKGQRGGSMSEWKYELMSGAMTDSILGEWLEPLNSPGTCASSKGSVVFDMATKHAAAIYPVVSVKCVLPPARV